ncbi:MAG: hypothetical protein SPJ59_02790 [Peptoniphilaceae bacterium]|nr:hypothetical protein [Peptoniphilaceae bacterium]
MRNYEQMGRFYLGKEVDSASGNVTDREYLYDSADLLTHAVCVGMTGSGKTGLGIDLLEEAAIDGIPVIAVDPKGDLTNLMLTFPELRAQDFLPWIHAEEAEREGISAEEYAARTAEKWREGLSDWNQDEERIRRYMSSVERCIYTPGSSAGRGLSLIAFGEYPGETVRDDEELLQNAASSAISGLLALLHVESDPLTGREHILMSLLLRKMWQEGKSMSMADMIRQIQNPGMDTVGVMPLESFFPQKDRLALAMKINNFMASPQMEVWNQGESLEISELLYTKEGKPKMSILSIAHLSDAERMFFLSILLNRLLAWTRTQQGTSALRAVFYMDEIFGYFPPVAEPPTKQPLLTLLKQARAYGLGIVLATQNPGDLDYKGLSNIGTWFIGRLQTQRDKEKLLDGLDFAQVSEGMPSREQIDAQISSLPPRTFFVRNIHESAPALLQTRWTLSYLAGPLMRTQISALVGKVPSIGNLPLKQESAEAERASAEDFAVEQNKKKDESRANAGGVPNAAIFPGKQYFLKRRHGAATSDAVNASTYYPAIYAQAQILFEDPHLPNSWTQEMAWMTAVENHPLPVQWEHHTEDAPSLEDLAETPEPGADFAPFPTGSVQKKQADQWQRDLVNYIYQNHRITLFYNAKAKLYSKPQESEQEFALRLDQRFREERDRALADLRAKYAKKENALSERLRRAEQALEREEGQARQAKQNTAVNAVATLLDGLFGRKKLGKTTLSKASSTARSYSRQRQQESDIARAEETVESLQRAIEDLNAELQQEMRQLAEDLNMQHKQWEHVEIKPKKSNITIRFISLLWVPEKEYQSFR